MHGGITEYTIPQSDGRPIFTVRTDGAHPIFVCNHPGCTEEFSQRSIALGHYRSVHLIPRIHENTLEGQFLHFADRDEFEIFTSFPVLQHKFRDPQWYGEGWYKLVLDTRRKPGCNCNGCLEDVAELVYAFIWLRASMDHHQQIISRAQQSLQQCQDLLRRYCPESQGE